MSEVREVLAGLCEPLVARRKEGGGAAGSSSTESTPGNWNRSHRDLMELVGKCALQAEQQAIQEGAGSSAPLQLRSEEFEDRVITLLLTILAKMESGTNLRC